MLILCIIIFTHKLLHILGELNNKVHVIRNKDKNNSHLFQVAYKLDDDVILIEKILELVYHQEDLLRACLN